MQEMSYPSDRPVTWLVTHRASSRATVVTAAQWVFARDAGSRTLGVDRYAVICERMEMVMG
jgi:hypothetical protein